MEIRGVLNSSHSGEPSKFVVEMTLEEISIIVKGSRHKDFRGDFRAVRQVEICEKFRHAMDIIERCEQAIALPEQLDVIAACMRTVIPKVTEIVKPPYTITVVEGSHLTGGSAPMGESR